MRDCSVYTQRAYALGLAHFFSWLHASGGDPDHVTRQVVGSYITELAQGVKQGAVPTHSAQKPRQPRTINHRLSVLASYFEYCQHPPSAKAAQYVFAYDDETIVELERAIAQGSGSPADVRRAPRTRRVEPARGGDS